jgi:hypothetical protein
MHNVARRLLVVPILALTFALGVAAIAPAVADAGYVYRPPRGGVLEQVAPDLVVTSTSLGYDYGYYTDAVVSNQGNTAAGGFYVSNNGSYIWVSGLNAGQSVVVRFYRGSACESGGTVTADAFNQVYELSEGNNSRSWSIIC